MSERTASQAQMAATIAGLIRTGTKADPLILLMKMSDGGRKLLEHAAGIEDPEQLIAPFREDPPSWKHLEHIPAEQLLAFAKDFLNKAAKR